MEDEAENKMVIEPPAPTEPEALCVGLLLSRPPYKADWAARKEWKQAILDHFKKKGVEPVPGAPFISIRMPCGNTVQYQNFEDIPGEDVPCPCGDEKHWFVKYGTTSPVSKN